MTRVRRDTGWRLFLRTVLARAYPRLIGTNRYKSWVFFEVWLPGVALATYVFVYRTLSRRRPISLASSCSAARWAPSG